MLDIFTYLRFDSVLRFP